MADVTLSYKGDDILELSDSGSATLKTGGKYCEADIAVEYVKPSGGGIPDLSDVYQLSFQLSETGNESFEAYAPNLDRLTVGIENLKEIHIHGLTELDGVFGTNAQGYRLDHIEVIDLDGAKTHIGQYSLRNRPYLKTVNAKIQITHAGGFLSSCPLVENIYFQENENVLSFAINGSNSLSDASLVSCANGLSDTVSMTLTTSADQKTSLNSIMGTVADGTFTTDANGTVTLMDFITNTKGWTVA